MPIRHVAPLASFRHNSNGPLFSSSSLWLTSSSAWLSSETLWISKALWWTEAPFFSLAIKKNPPKLIVAEDAIIPRDYLRVIPERLEPNKPEIAKALKSGIDVDGCRLETTTRLEIK